MSSRVVWGVFGAVGAIMNKGGLPYLISNPDGPGYSTDFEHNVQGPVDHFDVYGEVQTKYSQVYWTQNSPIALPPEIVSRFEGKIMAITGYEVDQVTHPGARPNYNPGEGDALGGFSCYPSCDDGDMSVPIYNAYNHHYFGWLVGKDAEVYKMDKPTFIPNPTWTGLRDKPHEHGYPTNIVFKENPGGEFRKSYHGYPEGYAQFVHSPLTWLVEPMQIDTHNRNYNFTDYTGYKPWFLPKKDANSTVTQLASQLSPLIECPCSDRIVHEVVNEPVILTKGVCPQPLTSQASCTEAIAENVQVSSSRTISDPSLPSGCLMVPDKGALSFSAVFNSAPSHQTCNFGSNSSAIQLVGQASLGGLTNLTIRHDGKTVTLSLTGPDGVWFGFGFNAGAMADTPYALIVDGQGNVQENKLADHNPGTVLKSSVTVISSTVTSGMRTVVLTRAVAGQSADYYSFPSTPGVIRMITATGSSSQLSYHKARTAAQIVLVPEDVSSCVCVPFTTPYLIYMNNTVTEYPRAPCAAEPRSDMLQKGDGTGRPGPNAACDVMSYNGGTHCCLHQWFLTDQGQSSLIPDQVDTYYLKWRYYFQEVTPANATTPASHQHLHHWVFLIDADVNDYEEDNANYGHQSIGNITARLTGKDIGLEDTPSTYNKIIFYVMTPHCHAPDCIREELWNADTNTLLCSSATRYGSAILPFDEADYVAMAPCLWGHQDGLLPPITIGPDTNLLAIKYFNNTFRHIGQMAQWTGLMKYDTDIY